MMDANSTGERVRNSQERKQYRLEDVTNMVFYAFYVSQGEPDLQKAFFDVFLSQYPGIRSECKSLIAALGENPNEWHQQKNFKELAARIEKYMQGRGHIHTEATTSINSLQKEIIEPELIMQLNELASAEEHPENPEKALRSFTIRLIQRDFTLLSKSRDTSNKEREVINTQRKRHNYSMLCRFALSPKRGAHLQSVASGIRQPPEFQHIWKKVGEYLRKKNADFLFPGSMTKTQLEKLIRAYQDETGEKITFP